MSRIAFLMMFFVFVASVGFWGMDQYAMQKELESDNSELEKREKEYVMEDVNEDIQDYVYGFFEGGSEIRVYEDIDLEEIKELLDDNYEVLVALDGSALDVNRYNFDALKLVKVSDYDGEFFYTSKYGMQVSRGVMISIRDFEKAYLAGGELVVGFNLD